MNPVRESNMRATFWVTAEQQKALDRFMATCDEARDAGLNVVAVVSVYWRDDANFSTRLSVNADDRAGVTEDHVVLDALREISAEWHNARHESQLCHVGPDQAVVDRDELDDDEDDDDRDHDLDYFDDEDDEDDEDD
jgi:hypothetical protein